MVMGTELEICCHILYRKGLVIGLGSGYIRFESLRGLRLSSLLASLRGSTHLIEERTALLRSVLCECWTAFSLGLGFLIKGKLRASDDVEAGAGFVVVVMVVQGGELTMQLTAM